VDIAEILSAAVPEHCPGAVALVVRDGVPGEPVAVGEALRYADDAGTLLPPAERVPMRADTVFDVASLTKLFTATVVLGLVEDGTVSLADAVVRWLPEFSRSDVTLRQLLSHTSGLPAHINLWERGSTVAECRTALLSTPLEGAPGTVFSYSCLGYITAGWLAEAATGIPLRQLVADRICGPLGLSDTGFLPSGEVLPRIAATEYEPYIDRGMVRGSVHDENSWRLGGAVGNAGIFSTAKDLARFGEMLRRGGELDGIRILGDSVVAEMLTDQLPVSLDPGYRQGLGPRIGDPSFMGSLATDGAIGHTGFTGTSLVVDRSRNLVVVLLTNRVHPSRERSSVVALRQQLADFCGAA
jgi:CubicO group peptidase (beta-lactamase class C family)